MRDKQIMINGVDIIKEKINMCFILLLKNKLETPETIEQTIYEHLDAFVKEWNDELARKTQECEQIKEKYEALKLENEEGYEIVDELKHEYEELENKIKKLRKNLALEIEASDRYRKALEEIEEYINSQGINHKWNMYIQRFRSGILDIINKAKDGE